MARKSATQPPHQAGPTEAPAAGAAPLAVASTTVATPPARLAATGTAAAPAMTGDPTPPAVFSAPLGPVAAAREYARCDLCGQPLGRDVGHFHMVSPLTARRISVCRTCRRAALSEGYRPRS